MSGDDARALAVRLAARAMARQGLVTAYGHVSSRIDADSFLVSSARPLGLVEPGDPGVVVPVSGPLPAGALPEVRMHQAIYRARADVGGVCRVLPPAVIALSALGLTPRALTGFGAYFAPAPPLWGDVALVRNDPDADRVAELLGGGNAIVLRGNGAVAVGDSIEAAAVHAFYLEEAAKVELAVLPARDRAREMTPDEAATRATRAGGLFERMWQFLCAADDEFAMPA